MIGTTAVSLRDWFFTPLDSGIGSTRIFTSGIEVHAQIVSHILSSSLDGRSGIYTWEKHWEWLWIFGWSLVGSILIWQWRNVQTKDRELQMLLWRSLSVVALGGILAGSCFVALSYGWWLPFAPAMIAFLGGGTIVTSYLALTAAQIRTYFSRYLTDAVVKSLLETPEGLKLGGDRRKVTILMCDLRGFSSISEKMAPEKVVEILNVFLGTMTEAIATYQGTIDEFIGDEIAMGIGINTGEVVAGNIGSQSRAKYAVVGNHVNLTARIESYTVGGQILISETTYKEVEAIAKTNGSMEVEPKGVSQPISIYDICGLGGSYNLELPSISESLQVLANPIAVTYRILEEKHLGTELFKGEIRRLSPYGAEIFAEEDIPVLTNLKLHLEVYDPAQELAIAGEIYAKVLKHQQSNQVSELVSEAREQELAIAPIGELDSRLLQKQSIYVHFTTVPSNLKGWIDAVSEVRPR
jgi:adenylate cyclase